MVRRTRAAQRMLPSFHSAPTVPIARSAPCSCRTTVRTFLSSTPPSASSPANAEPSREMQRRCDETTKTTRVASTANQSNHSRINWRRSHRTDAVRCTGRSEWSPRSRSLPMPTLALQASLCCLRRLLTPRPTRWDECKRVEGALLQCFEGHWRSGCQRPPWKNDATLKWHVPDLVDWAGPDLRKWHVPDLVDWAGPDLRKAPRRMRQLHGHCKSAWWPGGPISRSSISRAPRMSINHQFIYLFVHALTTASLPLFYL